MHLFAFVRVASWFLPLSALTPTLPNDCLAQGTMLPRSVMTLHFVQRPPLSCGNQAEELGVQMGIPS